MDERCPNCGYRLVKYVEREVSSTRRGKVIYRDNVFFKCDRCKTETDLNVEEDPYKIKKRHQRFEQGFLTDLDIKRIRQKLGLNQRQMAKKLGVGIKNFTRYETLTVRQSRAMDDLLRILDVYPEAIKVLNANQLIDMGKRRRK